MYGRLKEIVTMQARVSVCECGCSMAFLLLVVTTYLPGGGQLDMYLDGQRDAGGDN